MSTGGDGVDGAPAHLASVSIDGLERIAAELLPDDAYAYFSTGARDELTQRGNIAAWRAHLLVPRVVTGDARPDLSTTVLGSPLSLPLLIAPMAAQGLAHPLGELATARAAAAAGAGMIVSTSSHTPLEQLATVPSALTWFQLYPAKDAGATAGMIDRARAAGAKAIVVTVDSVLVKSTHRRPHGGPGLTQLPYPMHPEVPYEAAQLDWAGLARLVESAGIPIVVKGVLHPEDALRSVDAGCAAIVVSNHGGRQLDGAVPTALALADVAAAVGDSAEVYVDGGIRRGADILRALALGARAVLVGRPVLWGLAAAGEAGVARVLEVLRTELAEDAVQAGARDLAAIDPGLVRLVPALLAALGEQRPIRGR